MVKSRSRKDVPKVEIKRYEPTTWDIQASAVLVELESRKEEHHQKWGCERLITLVDSEFRERFWGQMARVWDAIDHKDIERLRKAIAGMIKGYDHLEKWGEDNEISQSPTNIRFVEWKTQSGQIMAVTETINDCIDLQKLRKDLTIWTLEEFEAIINEPAIQFIIKAKAFDPTAQVKRFKAGEDFGKGSGFDDMVDDLEPIYGGGDAPKMFNLPKRK
jgi:hypothetical protein